MSGVVGKKLERASLWSENVEEGKSYIHVYMHAVSPALLRSVQVPTGWLQGRAGVPLCEPGHRGR